MEYLVSHVRQAFPKIAPSIFVASTLQLLSLRRLGRKLSHQELLIRIFFLSPLRGDEHLAPDRSDLALSFVVRKKLGL